MGWINPSRAPRLKECKEQYELKSGLNFFFWIFC